MFCTGNLLSHFTANCTAHNVHLKACCWLVPYVWLQTGPKKTQACPPGLKGTPWCWCWYGRTGFLHWHTPALGRASWGWGEPASPCKRFLGQKALLIACPDAPYPGFLLQLSFSTSSIIQYSLCYEVLIFLYVLIFINSCLFITIIVMLHTRCWLWRLKIVWISGLLVDEMASDIWNDIV